MSASVTETLNTTRSRAMETWRLVESELVPMKMDSRRSELDIYSDIPHFLKYFLIWKLAALLCSLSQLFNSFLLKYSQIKNCFAFLQPTSSSRFARLNCRLQLKPDIYMK